MVGKVLEISDGRFMRIVLAFLIAGGLSGQPLRTGFVRGVIVENRSIGQSGEFSVRSGADAVFQFRSDGKTWIERENERIPASSLRAGELLEVVSDRDPKQLYPLHYARMVQVILQVRPRPPVRNGMYRLYRPGASPVPIIANFIYAGVIKELSDQRMVLRTKLDGDKIIYLRPDTRCVEQGSAVDPSALRPNTLVSVEGGKDMNDELEAYQVVWGRILEPAGLRE
ncbi:MAG: hypothetical protein JWO80_1122 [Bryobacterales bacterium]|nr:hypothetical protein [Bryobacterales bacterium]